MPLVVSWLKPGAIEAADAANKIIASKTTEPRKIMCHITVSKERTDKKRPANEKSASRLPNLAIISLVHGIVDEGTYCVQGLHESALSSALSTPAY